MMLDHLKGNENVIGPDRKMLERQKTVMSDKDFFHFELKYLEGVYKDMK